MSSVALHRVPAERRILKNNTAWQYATLYLFLAPFAVMTILFGLWPIADSIRIAFTESSTALSDAPVYVGLENFQSVLADSTFQSSLWRTLLYTVLAVTINVSAAVGLAVLLAHPALRRGRTLFKLAIFLPVITPDVASFIVWKWMFNQNFGIVNHALLSLGLPPFPGVTQPVSAFATLLIVEAWQHVGLYTLIFLTNLQLLDRTLDESAQIDGANGWQRLIFVTIPQLRPAITINTVYALIEFLKTFTVIFVITKGGPNFSTNFISYYAYTKFTGAQYGEATAIATILFVIVFGLAASAYAYLDRSANR
ncbi:Multiple sugar transport system permease protein/fructooligosaccharide transport system permease protein [Hyphomicrobiales bacterium]|nr:Multiple sugar transport system permease protein/fructooligosaccharide transport system permease protein [Hyphomicrobiales bacterium]CAH1695836.1 Multiple sugar transport system permease protein/fructooligosaccharide transport system permease protein [Hyphomicrobiales bacterium]